jgi:TetR/AcrR family transcriptional regulator, transcriptional repressor for nem operon
MANPQRPDADGAGQQHPDKRDRLISSARKIFYEQGVERTTIADVARAASIPVGNVYHYFQTKGELVAAVIAQQGTTYETVVDYLGQLQTPKARLKGLIEAWVGEREALAAQGFPRGTLSAELRKHTDELGSVAADTLEDMIDWIEYQFTEMGRGDAHELAVALLAAYEGISVLADLMEEPGLVATEARRLKHWIDTLA